jgi:O-antigen ligase
MTRGGPEDRGPSMLQERLAVLVTGPHFLWFLALTALGLGLVTGMSPLLGVLVLLTLALLLVLRSENLVERWDAAFLHVLLASVFVESVSLGGVTVGRFLALGCVVAIAVRVVIQGRTLGTSVAMYCLPALAFTLMYAVSGLWSPHLSDWLFSIGQVCLALLYFAAVLVLTPERDPASIVGPLLRTYVVGAVVVGLYGLVQVFWADRAAGLQGDPNIYAMYQVAAVPAALVLKPRSRHRWAYAVAIVVVLASVLASGSRGGIITAAATLLASALILAPRHQRTRLLAGGVLVALALAWLSFATNQRTANVAQDRASGRIDIWHVAWTSFLENPVVGIGSGQFKPASIDLLVTTPGVELVKSHLLLGEGIEVHNLYLEALAERGLTGFVLLLVLLVTGARWLLRSRTPRHPEVAALFPMLVSFIVATVFLSIPNNKLLWILLGLAVVLDSAETGVGDLDRPHGSERVGGRHLASSSSASTDLEGRP